MGYLPFNQRFFPQVIKIEAELVMNEAYEQYISVFFGRSRQVIN
jgi:hypothetical protein